MSTRSNEHRGPAWYVGPRDDCNAKTGRMVQVHGSAEILNGPGKKEACIRIKTRDPPEHIHSLKEDCKEFQFIEAKHYQLLHSPLQRKEQSYQTLIINALNTCTRWMTARDRSTSMTRSRPARTAARLSVSPRALASLMLYVPHPSFPATGFRGRHSGRIEKNALGVADAGMN